MLEPVAVPETFFGVVAGRIAVGHERLDFVLYFEIAGQAGNDDTGPEISNLGKQ